VAYLLALGSAALYGAADFMGGVASRRASTIAIVAVSQAAGLLLLGLILPMLPGSPSRQDLMWGGVAGLAGGVGVALLYRALAIGTMAVVAPITAVCAVALPVVVEAIRGERLAAVTVAGILLAVAAIVLVSQSRSTERRSGGITLALMSGVAIGLFFLSLARTDAAAGLWPLLAARFVSVGLFVAIAIAGSHSLRLGRPVMKITVACGVVDILANALYVLATRHGSLSVVVTLSSLYPASTVLLARVVLGERLSGVQAVGIVCALVAVVLIVATT
jgi:drug/metabolite transporter (DMT)-like permease